MLISPMLNLPKVLDRKFNKTWRGFLLSSFLCKCLKWLRGTERERMVTFTYYGYITPQRRSGLSQGSPGLYTQTRNPWHGEVILRSAPLLPGIRAACTVFERAAIQTHGSCGRPGLSLSSNSHCLSFNCFEAERSPQGAQQDVLQRFEEMDY